VATLNYRDAAVMQKLLEAAVRLSHQFLPQEVVLVSNIVAAFFE
jgi:hypothetical protein